jgi:hypothetical protein
MIALHFRPRQVVLAAILAGAVVAPSDARASTVHLTKPQAGTVVIFDGVLVSKTCGIGCTEAHDSAGKNCDDPDIKCRPPLTLQAEPGAGVVFESWTGCPHASGAQCVIPWTPRVAARVHATFVDIQKPSVPTLSPAGPGPVRASIQVIAEAQDNVGVTEIALYDAAGSLVAHDDSAPFEMAVDTSRFPDGVHSISARAFDEQSNESDPGSLTLAIDNTQPQVTFPSDNPDTTPGTRFRNVTVKFAAADAGGLTTVECSVGSAADRACTAATSHTMANLADGVHTLSVRARDRAGNIKVAPHQFRVDATPPVVVITNAPSLDPGTPDPSPTLTFTADDTVKLERVECQLDGSEPRRCASPLPYLNLSDGIHEFSVRAVDAVGNETLVSRKFKVDRVAPDTTITSGPAEGRRTREREARFEFAATEAGSFTCRLDGAVLQPCPTPLVLSRLTEGRHTLEVWATDRVGREDPTPATRSWLVDVTPPALEVVGGPSIDPGTAARSATVMFRTGDATNVECSLDSETTFRECTSAVSHTLTDLTDGVHTLRVRAADEAGNHGALAHRFLVDTTAPDTTILDGPAAGSKTSQPTARFEFASEPGAALTCRLDGAPYPACSSPLRLEGLAPGPHRFEISAADRLGNVDATPATRTWTVVADDDGDGYDRGLDCNEGDPRINPGARDIPGNRVDEDCKLGPAPYPRITAGARIQWLRSGANVRVTKLTVFSAAQGTTVAARCSGSRCPFRVKRRTAMRDGQINLTSLLKRRWLTPKTRLTLVIRRPEEVGLHVEFAVRAERAPARIDRCLTPGTDRPAAC